jgi:DnaK suppressor protein
MASSRLDAPARDFLQQQRRDLEQERDRLRELMEAEGEDLQRLAEARRSEHGFEAYHADVAGLTEQQEQVAAESEATQADLARIEAALHRLDEGTYGRCEDCGRPIPIERLRALPAATRDVRCQALHEKGRHSK